jgi:cysteine desulfurase
VLYLDYNASTPVDPRVQAVVMDALSRTFGNPSSVQHLVGQEAAERVEEARAQVAALVGARASEVVFTSGASEALTLAVLGVALADPARPDVAVSAIEHKAVLTAAELAARLTGGRVRLLPVTSDGVVDLDRVADQIDGRVGLTCVMFANNETGVLQPVREVADRAASIGSRVLCDVTQGVGKAKVSMEDLGVDLVAFSSHKIYGPKGAGALIGSRQTLSSLVSVFPGGGQERGLRGGTQDVPTLAGFGKAAELAAAELDNDAAAAGRRIDRLISIVQGSLADIRINGRGRRISNTVNLRLVGADAEAVMASMPHVAVSTGSACQSAVPTVSHVLTAMGLSRADAEECIRISVGRFTTDAEIDQATSDLVAAVSRVRALSAA